LEGVIGKQRDSVYEPGKRSGAWIKHRVNLGQEFVIGGFTPGPHGLDAVVIGYYRGDDLVYDNRQCQSVDRCLPFTTTTGGTMTLLLYLYRLYVLSLNYLRGGWSSLPIGTTIAIRRDAIPAGRER